MKHTNKWFTLVELIVVVTILAILSTIWFVAYSSYLSWVRDTNRVAQLKSIYDGLRVVQSRWQLPLPDDYIEIKSWTDIIWYQWFAGENVLESIEYSAEWLDPKDNWYFTYSMTNDWKYYSLMSMLENDLDDTLSPVVFQEKVSALNYINRTPYIQGKKVWILLDDTNTPIQSNVNIRSDGFFDVLGTSTDQFSLYFDNKEVFYWVPSDLVQIIPYYDCKRIKDLRWSSQDWIYSIDPDGDWITSKVYCDMTTDWGGWTYATMLADETTQNLFSESNTGNSEFITSITKDIYTKWKLSNVWIDDRNRDILLQCFSSESEHKWYEIPVIIYDFIGTEKNNLTTLSKAGNQFSSKNLSAKWKNRRYTLETLYGSSSTEPYSMKIDSLDGIIFYINPDQLAAFEYSHTNSPAYSDPSNYQAFSSQVYCVSAIR